MSDAGKQRVEQLPEMKPEVVTQQVEYPLAKADADAASIDVLTLGQMVLESGMFPSLESVSQAVVKILLGKELGFPTVTALIGIHVDHGNVGLTSELRATAIRRSGRYDYKVTELTDEACTVEIYRLHSGAEPELLGKERYSKEDAVRAGLEPKSANEYFARALSHAQGFYAPDVFGVPVYDPSELEEMRVLRAAQVPANGQ